MLFALADAVVLTLPEAEPLAVPAPSLTPVPFVMSEVKAEPAAAVTVLSAPMPFTVTSLLLLSPVVVCSRRFSKRTGNRSRARQSRISSFVSSVIGF